jgi:hypothetical protein
MQAPSEVKQETLGEFFLFWSGLALLLILFGVVIIPTLNMGLVTDDFFLLVNDRNLPLTQAVDELHRPLRNIILKLAGSWIGIHQVLPYRLLVAGTYLAVLALIFRLTRRLGTNRLGALAAVFIVAFFPRNQEVIYWFAAWQDLWAGGAVLCACLCFLDFRESGRVRSLLIAAISYLVALGFKETTVVLPALLALIDIYREQAIPPFWRKSFWGAYIPFVCALLVYVVYFFADAGVASLAGGRTGGYYGFHGVGSVVAAVIRTLLKFALPYSAVSGFKDVRPLHVAILLAEAGFLLVLISRLRVWSAAVLAAGWMICTILPTAAFAATFNADRYLFVPMLGAAIFVGLSVHALLQSHQWKKYAGLAYVALVIYASVGIVLLIDQRGLWQAKGDEAALVIRETMRLSSKLPAGSEIDFVNVKFGNGLSEALHAGGLSYSIRIVRNLPAPDTEQQKLVTDLLRCGEVGQAALHNRTIFVETADGNRLHHLDAGCASSLVDSDLTRRPAAWNLLYSSR